MPSLKARPSPKMTVRDSTMVEMLTDELIILGTDIQDEDDLKAWADKIREKCFSLDFYIRLEESVSPCIRRRKMKE